MDELALKITGWLAKGSIPLEYHVADVMRRKGFGVSQGRSYPYVNDDGSTTHREIDVLGQVPVRKVAVQLVVECKRTDDKPWLVLTNQESLGPVQTLSETTASERAQRSLVDAFVQSQGRGMPSMFASYENPGFAVTVITDLSATRQVDERPSDDRNRARDAMSQVVSAARGMVLGNPDWALAWPVVVISGPLFEVRYDGPTPQVVGADWKRVSWWNSPFGGSMVVDIVTEAHFAGAYVEMAWHGLCGAATRLDEDYSIVSSDR